MLSRTQNAKVCKSKTDEPKHPTKMPWFRLCGDKWKADTRGLNHQEKAVYIDLLVEMHEREEPLSDERLDQVRSLTRTRPTTFNRAIERLVALGLFARVVDGLWSNFMEDEIESRSKRTEKARRNGEKSRRNSVKSCQNPAQNLKIRPEKSQQNQRSGVTTKTQTQIHREAAYSASLNGESFNLSSGSASACAGRPQSGGEKDSLAGLQDANLTLEETFRAAGESIEVEPFIADCTDLSDDDEAAEWDYEGFSDEDFAERASLVLEGLGHSPKGIDRADPVQVVAYDEGIFAAKYGMARNAVPLELRTKSRRAAADAWQRGHDYATSTATAAELEKLECVPF